MPSEKYTKLIEGYNSAVDAYLKEQKVIKDEKEVDSNDKRLELIEKLPVQERVSQLKAVNAFITSLKKQEDHDAEKLLVFLDTLAQTISVTPYIGHSELKNNLQKLVKEHMPVDDVLKARLFNNFNTTINNQQDSLASWFKGCEKMGKDFIRKFYELYNQSFIKATQVQQGELEKLFTPKEKVSAHSILTASSSVKDEKPDEKTASPKHG
ncbi:hypothetical protein [Legionella sp. W05-934-2]|jgi:hypothetical protein|uniref:hypothetical protein n=1 Tax=Legionella sp. W05-934-2 TaxID=1198649 RepID=UPI0034618770